MKKTTTQLKNENVTLILTKYDLVGIALMLQSETLRKEHVRFLGYSEDKVDEIQALGAAIVSNIDYSDLETSDKNIEEAKGMLDWIYAFTLRSVRS